MQNHKVYKVEQTNDVYCVVSGVPDRIRTHAPEMANFTIELMKNIDKFQLKDFPGVEIKVRAGVHSGEFPERNSNQIRKLCSKHYKVIEMPSATWKSWSASELFRCPQKVKFLLLSKIYYFWSKVSFLFWKQLTFQSVHRFLRGWSYWTQITAFQYIRWSGEDGPKDVNSDSKTDFNSCWITCRI